MIGVIRLILEIVHPVPRCGEPDTRPAILSKVHGFYFSQLMMLIELILVVGISLLTKRNTEEEVNMSCFISFLYLDLCVFGDDAWINQGSFMQTTHI